MYYRERTAALKFIVPLVLAVFFLLLSVPSNRRAPWYAQLWWAFVSPPQSVVMGMRGAVKKQFDRYFYLVNAATENGKLKKRVAELENRLITMNELKAENQRFEHLLSYRADDQYQVLTAKVVSNDPRAEFRTITINVGSKDGIKPFMPVVGSKGLVGRIGEVGRSLSKVLMITDPNSSVDAFIQRSRQRTLVVGEAGKSMIRPHFYLSRLEYLMNRSDVVKGDVVITSGLDAFFPSGIPIGSVSNVEKTRSGVFWQAELMPYENMAELTEVLVILKDVR